MDNWWNVTVRGKCKYLEKDLFQCHFVCHKTYMDWPGIEPWGVVVNSLECYMVMKVYRLSSSEL